MKRRVAFHRCGSGAGAGTAGHDNQTKAHIARSIASLLGADYAGELVAAPAAPPPILWVPSDTLLVDEAQRLGVKGPDDIFGGVVPYPHAATKVITHPLIAPDAARPAAWSPAFGTAVRDAVLPGYSAFSLPDAWIAGLALLESGAVRLKQADGVGGGGQSVATTELELNEQLAAMGRDAVERHGLVLELNLERLTTYSVGQVRVGPWLATYVGTQYTTPNHRGDEVYGGSQLTLARGDYDQLLQLELSDEARQCVEQALVYHRHALASFPGLLATRCNYDVVLGTDAAGLRHVGVLEQSWRIGGASGAEIAGLIALRDDPSLAAVCAATHETYEPDAQAPSGGIVHYQGRDAHGGPLLKYASVNPCR